MNLLKAAYSVLKKNRIPMSAADIYRIVTKKGLWSTSGKTPAATLAAALYVDLKRNGGQSLFVKVDKGLFGLRGVSYDKMNRQAKGDGASKARFDKSDIPGYVYILTNPSFRKDWVKIGKTARPVNTRSKELDNTAVPLPFEIYATLKTCEYAKAERLIHKMIDRFTNKRIRKSREFFNIEPQIALEILRDVREVLGGELQIEGVVKTEHKHLKKSKSNPVFVCVGNGASAMGKKSGAGILVLKGSKISQTTTTSFKKHNYCKLRSSLEENQTIVSQEFAKDCMFNSLSAASSVILGRASNGKICWRPK